MGDVLDVAGQIASQLVPGHDAALALSSVGLQPRLDVELRRPECAAAMALSLMGPEGSIYAETRWQRGALWVQELRIPLQTSWGRTSQVMQRRAVKEDCFEERPH